MMLVRRAALAIAVAGTAGVYAKESGVGQLFCLPGMSSGDGSKIIPDNCPMSSNYKKKVPPPPPPPSSSRPCQRVPLERPSPPPGRE